MKMHDLLDGMLDSRSKVRVQRLLFRFPGRDFTEREIARTIGMSPNTVNLALRDLRQNGIFIYKRVGRTHLYRCNKESALFPMLESLFESERELSGSLMDLIRQRMGGVESCIVFGSFARNEETSESDLDLLVIARDREKAEKKADALADEMLRRFSTVLSPVVLTPAELRARRRKPFIREALAEGMLIRGKKP